MAKDKVHEQNLAELGIDPANPDEAVEKLRSLRTSGAAGELKIAAAAGQIISPAAAQLLTEMEPGASGALRREIRRALFKLRQHGIEIPSAAPRSPAIAAVSEPNISALLSPVDPEGARVVWLMKARPQGGLAWLQGLYSETEGLVGANLIHISRREAREERREFERRARIKLVDADYRLADFILYDAYRRTPQERLGQVGNFLMLRAEILDAPLPVDFQHPIYTEFAASLSQQPSPDLFNEPELEGWIIAQSELQPYLNEVEQIRQSPLVLNQFQQQERVNAVVERAIDQLLGGERGTLMRRRLEDMAYYLARTGRTDAARWAASAAARIRDGEALSRVPFFVQYVMRSMELVLSQQQTQTERQPRLIMTPAEAMRAQAAARARQQRR
jgi:hypothetical protein